MRPTFVLLGNELRLFVNDKVAIGLTFLVPIVLIYLFGNVFGVGRSSSGPTGIPLAVVSQSEAPANAAITAALQKEKAFKVLTTKTDSAGAEHLLTEPEVREMMRAGTLRYALVFPASTPGGQSVGVKMKFLNNPRNEIESQTVNGLIQKTVYTSAPQALLASLQGLGANFIGEENFAQFQTSLAQNIANAFGGDPAEIAAQMKNGNFGFLSGNSGGAGGGSIFESLIKIESEEVVGSDVRSPAATRAVGGWAMMFLLFSLTGASTSLFDEKKAGLYQRLLAAPVRRTHILWSKYLFGMLLGLVQLCALFGAGHLLFGIDIASNFFNLVLICLAASTACVAFGMLLAAISPTSAVANGLGTLLILTMSAVGGAWFPTSFMPEFIQHLSKFTIVYWAIDGFLKVLWASCTTVELLPTLGILFGIAAVVNVFSVWRFNRGQVFE